MEKVYTATQTQIEKAFDLWNSEADHSRQAADGKTNAQIFLEYLSRVKSEA